MSAPAPFRLLAATVRVLLLTVRGMFAAAAAALLLAGLPYGLIRYIGWPLPHQVPSLPHLTTDLTSPILGDQVYLNAIAIVIWLLWLLITVSFTAETIALLRGVEIPPLPGLRPTQALAVILLTAIGLTALMARTAAPAQAATTTAHVPSRAPAAASAPVRPGPAQVTDTTGADASGPTLTHPAETDHTVVTGDNLYDIARADYGDGNDWTLLYTYNAGATQADGQKLSNPDLIKPGWVLHTTAPAAQSTTPVAATTSPPTRDSTTPPSTHDTAPTPQTTAPTETPTTAAHPSPAPSRTATPDPQTTSNSPAPRHATDSPARHHSASPTVNSDWVDLAEGGALAAIVLAGLALALRRTRRLSRWYSSCYWPTPDQTPTGPVTVPARLRPAARRTTVIDSTDQRELDEFGAPTDPHLIATTPAEDPHVTVHAENENESGALLLTGTAASTETTGEEDGDGEPGPARISVGAADGQILALQDLAPSIALTGPGALGAARAVAATVLSAIEHQHDGARLLISRQDAALLLACSEVDLPARLDNVPDLELAADSTDALTRFEEYVTYRTRLLEENEVATLEQTADYDLDYFPPVVLIAVARPDHAGRLAATLAASANLRTHAVLLGDLPGTPTWRVDADGRLHAATTPGDARMFHLSADALADALALLEDATGDTLREQTVPVAPDPSGELATPSWEPDDETAADEEDSVTDERDAATVGAAIPEAAQSTQAPGPAAATEESVTHSGPVPVQSAAGPLLLVSAADSDHAAQITDEYASRPVRIKVLGVRTITTPTGAVDAKLRADAWRVAMKLATVGRHGQHTDDFAALWPDQDDHTLRVTVKNAVYDLRKTFKQRCGDTGNNPNRYITQANRRYTLNEHTVGIDLMTFYKLRTVAAQTRDVGQRAAAACAALDLYDGELLSGEEEEWMIAPRAKTRRDALATATLLAQLADQAGDPEAALDWWERALQIDDNEEVYRQIITAQGRLGRRADALATRDLLVTRLNADGLSPAPETMAVLANVLSRRPGSAKLVGSGNQRGATSQDTYSVFSP
jgi:DNA-binding SARP family transcriptional activator/LysM repeat protein